MHKVCVFCGEKPQSKNNEHIIPSWIIELTGDPRRVALFGIDKTTKDYVPRTFAFQSFRFPACQECNNLFSALETSAKDVVHKILAEEPLSTLDLSTFLDWLDKIRVGLWLGYLYLDRNPQQIRPKFYITSRIAAADRLVVIYRENSDRQGVSFIGCDIPSFQNTPSCFTLVINNYYFLNISIQFLFSRRLGLPYPKFYYYRTMDEIVFGLVEGLERILKPLLKRPFLPRGIHIYQPILSKDLVPELHDTEYVKEYSLDWSKGIGQIFIQRDDTLALYPSNPSMDWLPDIESNIETFYMKIGMQTLHFQMYLENMRPLTDELSKGDKDHLKREKTRNKQINLSIIRAIQKKNKGKDNFWPLIYIWPEDSGLYFQLLFIFQRTQRSLGSAFLLASSTTAIDS